MWKDLILSFHSTEFYCTQNVFNLIDFIQNKLPHELNRTQISIFWKNFVKFNSKFFREYIIKICYLLPLKTNSVPKLCENLPEKKIKNGKLINEKINKSNKVNKIRNKKTVSVNFSFFFQNWVEIFKFNKHKSSNSITEEKYI